VEADRIAPLRGTDGRALSHRGQLTRSHLLQVTRELLDEATYRSLRVVDIARAARTSSATFYQYFAGVEEAVVSLAEELSNRAGAQLQAAAESEDPAELVGCFLQLWRQHRALLAVIDLAALAGDERFRALRTALLNPVSETLAARIDRSGVDSRATAGVLVSMLAHVAAHQAGLREWGASEEGLSEALARVVRNELGREAWQPE